MTKHAVGAGKDFWLVVAGQVISLFGNAVLRFALPLYLLRETQSPALFGLVNACSFLPMVLLSLVGGVLADRVNKQRIMVVLDFFTAALVTALTLLLSLAPLVGLLIAFLMLLYAISGAYQPSVQASIPALLAPERLMWGNAIVNQVSTLSGLLGPVLGGLMFGAWGIRPLLMTSAACFLLSAVMELFIRIPFIRRPRDRGALATAWSDLAESMRFVRRDKPDMLAVVAFLSAFNLVLSASMVVGIPVLVVNELGLSDALLGFTQGAMGLGGLVGGVLAAVAGQRMALWSSPLLLLTCALTAVFMGLPLLMGLPVMACYGIITAMGFIAMGAATLFTVKLMTLVQQQTPSYLVGKVMAALAAISGCAHPLGQALYGLLLNACPAWAVMVGAGVVALPVCACSRKIFASL